MFGGGPFGSAPYASPFGLFIVPGPPPPVIPAPVTDDETDLSFLTEDICDLASIVDDAVNLTLVTSDAVDLE